MVDAIILAGGSAKELDSAPAKGLVSINGRPMVEYVIGALRQCEDIDRICVVVPVEYSYSESSGKVGVKVASGTLPQVAKTGIDCLGSSKPVLMLSADIPLITPEAISDFLKRCAGYNADFYYPIVRYGESEKRFPDVKRTYARVREGRFTGGNIILINPRFINRNMGIIERIYELRKKPIKIAQVLGFSFLFRFVLGMLTIGQIEDRIGQLTNSVCRAVETPYVEIGIDVDKESDLQLVKAVLVGG
ncbi:MAG: nucleotidyltransferase family protein [Firmicutes bacterium]|nr:nucleotidyltransferase family protein [Bacillota bacterium]